MSQINPFTGSILQAPDTQRLQSAEKDRQVRKAQDAVKNAGLTEDKLEHQVESSEELTQVHQDQQQREREKKGKKRKPEKDSTSNDDNPHLDLTA
jgi:hypothetical protein